MARDLVRPATLFDREPSGFWSTSRYSNFKNFFIITEDEKQEHHKG